MMNLHNKIFFITKRISHIYTLPKKTTRFTFVIEYLENNRGFITYEIYPNNMERLQFKNINKK